MDRVGSMKIKRTKVKRSKVERILYPIVFVLLTIYSVFLLYHFYFALQLATKFDSPEFSAHFDANKLATWSKRLNFANFITAFQVLEVNGNNYFMLVLNSIWYSIGSMVLSLFFTSCTTYVVCKYKFFGRNFLYAMVIFTMMLPVVGAMPATYRFYKSINIINSPAILLTALGGFGGNFLILYSFYKGIAWEYAEAAFIDGAGHLKVYLQIMLPMALPAISVLFVTGFITHWNEYMAISIYMPKMPTLSYGLYVYESNMKYLGNQPVYFAGVLLAVVPCLALFLISQNTIMQTVHLGGIKG